LNNINTSYKTIKIPNCLYNVFRNIKFIFKDKAFIYSILAILVKIFLFFAVMGDHNVSKFNFKTMFFNVPPIMVYLSFICMFLSFTYLFKGKKHLFSIIILDILLTILMIGDLWYFRSNRSFLTFHMLSYTANLHNLSDSIFAMFRPIDLIFLLDILILLLYFFKIKNSYLTFKRNFSSFLILFIITLFYLPYAHYKIDISKNCFSDQHLFFTTWTQDQNMFNLTPIGFHIYDGYSFYKDSRKHTLTNSEKKEIETWFKAKAEKLPDNKYKGIFKGKNLITIQIESLENFVIGKSIDGEEITPNLNKLLKNSLYFNNIKEQTFAGTTSDAELLANTSIFPVRRGSTFFRYPNNTYPSSLPKLLEDIGYNTIAIHPDKGSYWNWLPSLSSIGFKKCIDSSHFNMDETIGLGLSDGSFFKQLVPILKQQKNPFYSFSITLSNHAPFSMPEKFKDIKIPDKLKGTVIGKYFESVHYTDKVIGQFINSLENNNLLENSIIVFYGDHEGPHKFFQDQVQSIKGLPKWSKKNDLNTPLIIYSKDYTGETINTYGGEVDITPTLAYLLGVKEYKYIYSTMGRNILNTKRNFAILPNGTIKSKNLTKKEIDMFSKATYYSNKIIESNYFKKEH